MHENRPGEPPRSDFEADSARLQQGVERETAAAKEKLKEGKAEIAQAASSAAQSVKESAYKGAETGKQYAADGLGDFTAAIRKASDELGNRDQSLGSNLAREAASGLEQLSGALKGKTVQDLTRSVAGFARQQPGAFLLGAALAGVALGRFAKASNSGHSHADTRVETKHPATGTSGSSEGTMSSSIEESTSVLGAPAPEHSKDQTLGGLK